MAGLTPARLLAAVAVVGAAAEVAAYESAAGLGAAAFGTAVAAVAILVVLPRVDPRAHPVLAVSFALSALFTCVAFWSALPFAFGAAAVAAAGRLGHPAAVTGVVAAILAATFCVLA